MSTSPDGNFNPDATIDTSLAACKTDKDCSGGASCAFPILVGCGAKGVCLTFTPDADTCIASMQGCACTGGMVEIPGCWAGFGYAPVAVSGTAPCKAD